MRFWITRNGEVPIREQLVRQVVLGILSEDLPAGHKLPSVRALARRHQIHSNTVSAAYHDLLEQGWLELRRGSGIYVRATPAADGDGELDAMLTAVLQAARARGHDPEEVLLRFERLVRPKAYERIVIVEPDAAMREILSAEIRERLAIPLEAVESAAIEGAARALVVALPTRAGKIRRELPRGVLCIALRLRSVEKSLEGETRPDPRVMISIVSRSAEIRQVARAMLIAVGLAPEGLNEVDAASDGWRDRIGAGSFVVTDVIAARELPPHCLARVFRVIADASIEELRGLCHSEK